MRPKASKRRSKASRGCDSTASVTVEGAISNERREGCFWKGKVDPLERFRGCRAQLRLLCSGLCLAEPGEKVD